MVCGTLQAMTRRRVRPKGLTTIPDAHVLPMWIRATALAAAGSDATASARAAASARAGAGARAARPGGGSRSCTAARTRCIGITRFSSTASSRCLNAMAARIARRRVSCLAAKWLSTTVPRTEGEA